jgi:hypothetical protein
MPEVQSRTYANPRRLPRRNRYQEGPGFLFVAAGWAAAGGRNAAGPGDGRSPATGGAPALGRR